MRRLITLIITFYACFSTLYAQGGGQQFLFSDFPLEKSQFREDFDSIHSIVVQNYSLYKQKGIDMDALYSRFCSRVDSEVNTREDYGKMLLDYFAALNAGHAFMLSMTHSADYVPVLIEDRLWVENPNELLLSNGFKDKDEIIAINDIPVKQWLKNTAEHMPGSTPQAKLTNALDMTFASYTDTERKYTLHRGDSLFIYSIRLENLRSKVLGGTADPVSAKQLNNSTGYIEISTMVGDVITPFAREYDKLKHLPNLIVDIRQNGGGNSANGIALCEYLLKNPLKHCLDGRMIQPRDDAYNGQVYLLVGPRTFSAAESFAIDMIESGEAILVGEPTAGDTGNNPQMFSSKYGIPFIIPVREPGTSLSGFPLEGIGIPPTVESCQSVNDFRKGTDTVIEEVINIAESKKGYQLIINTI